MLTKTIPSYLYQEYNDDEALQAFVDAYNTSAQGYVDWFSAIELPVYTSPTIAGDLLDWVAEGLYGMPRPSLSSAGQSQTIGPLGTGTLNELALDELDVLGGASPSPAVTDDVFKRILTWHFYKGDGKDFSVGWLKRRIWRFLRGENGVGFDVDQTYNVSVTFGPGTLVTIGLSYYIEKFSGIGYFIIGETAIGGVAYPAHFFDLAPVLKAAIEGGVLELPFQFTYAVDITQVT
jgi:hypothetical protein